MEQLVHMTFKETAKLFQVNVPFYMYEFYFLYVLTNSKYGKLF